MKNALMMVALVSFSAIGAETATPPVAKDNLTVAQRVALREKNIREKMGGMIAVRGTPAGSFVILNAQTKVAATNFDYSTGRSCRWAKGLCKIVDGTVPKDGCLVTKMGEIMSQQKADFLIAVVDKAGLPASLIALESRWAILNVAALEDGLKSPDGLTDRARKEFVRVFCALSGGFSSQFKVPLINSVVKVSDLDSCESDPPADINARLRPYLELRGVKPEQKITYRKACEQGWAPTPTNEFQKAVWDKVHAIPSKPMKISYDKAAQKPVVK